MSLLTLVGVDVARRRRPVLSGIDLTVRAGDVIAVLGPNGAGKSSLLLTLGGQLAPARGEVRREGRVASALQSSELARRSARANVELALAWWGVPRAERSARADAALRELRAEHLCDRPAWEISGGERRRVHLARACALRPDVLLLDEPFAGLDPEARAALLLDAGVVLAGAAQAVVLVLHERAEAWALANRLVVVIDGRIAADGAPQELLEQPPTAEVARFLGWTGELSDAEGRLLTRSTHVHLDPAGSLSARVARRTALEDGVRLDLELAEGRLEAVVGHPGPAVGDQVRVRLAGGRRL